MSTGRVVIASATCVNRDDAFLMGIQAVVVPGKGVAACQAGVDNTHTNQMLVFAELQKGTEPERIIELLIAGSGVSEPAVRHSRSLGSQRRPSGLTNGYVTQDIQGRVPGTQIYYSIQGNILRPGEVVPNAVAGIPRAQRRDHGSRDGRDGSRRRERRRQPVHVPAAARRRHRAGDSLRRARRRTLRTSSWPSGTTRTATRTTTASTRCTSR